MNLINDGNKKFKIQKNMQNLWKRILIKNIKKYQKIINQKYKNKLLKNKEVLKIKVINISLIY